MQYDIEGDWNLLATCNYRCAYCFDPVEKLGSKLLSFASPEQWRAAFAATDRRWLLHITGGEPSIYPGFVDLCEAVTRDHHISLNSNLSHAAFVDFADRIDPSQVSFINAGFHLEERERRSGLAVFLRHADLLRRRGFRLIVSLVATPEALERFPQAIDMLKPVGLVPVPKLLRGPVGDRLYPNDYTKIDKTRFRKYAAMARKSYRTLLADVAERPSVDLFGDDRYLDGLPQFLGLSCDAGTKFAYIRANGDVFRCGPVDRLGNLLDGTFVPWTEPAACNTYHCYYFCNKYARREPVSFIDRTIGTLGAGVQASRGIASRIHGLARRISRPGA